MASVEDIKGVFADLDDGGLTEDEALAQIRDLIGLNRGPKRVLFTYLIPVQLRVNLEEQSIESAEVESGTVWGPLPYQIVMDADTKLDLDPEIRDEIEERVKAIADDGGWVYDIQWN